MRRGLWASQHQQHAINLNLSNIYVIKPLSLSLSKPLYVIKPLSLMTAPPALHRLHPSLCGGHPAPCQTLVHPGKWGLNLGVKSPVGDPCAGAFGARLSNCEEAPKQPLLPTGREACWEPRG